MSQHDSGPEVRVYVCGNASAGNRALLPLRRLEASGRVAVEQVPCSGRIDPRYLLKAFEAGTRAICVVTCAAGHCQSLEGNLRLERRAQVVRALLDEAGLDSAALRVVVPQDAGERAAEAALDSVASFVQSVLRPPYRMVA